MEPGPEWITTRAMNLVLIGGILINQDELLTVDAMEAIRGMADRKRLLDGNFRLRTFKPQDQTAVRQLVLEGLGERWGIIDETRNPDLDDISAHYISHGHTVLIAEDDNRLLGTGTLIVEAGHAQLVRMSVKSTERGRGIASAIVEELIEMARQRGVKRIEVETNNDWYSAIRLYARHGFVEYNRDTESVYLARELV